MSQFCYSTEMEMHRRRRKEIMATYPEVQKLQGPDSMTIYAIIGLVIGQLALSVWAQNLSWWGILLLSYFVGAVLAHALFVMIHEACHNLVFHGSFANKVAGLICDIPLVFPSALGFRHYHMIHHRYLGHLQNDPDVCSDFESRLVGHAWWRKFLWMMFFSISQALRPLKLPKSLRKFDGWMVANIVVCAIAASSLYFFVGGAAVIYLLISTLFALGLHPLGGRWIQEHYTLNPEQETYSYYGPLNWISFNIGYHNEHHDLMNISWRRLPALKRMAPEFYDGLDYHRSWTVVILRFIFSPKYSPYSRIVRQ